MSETIQPAPAVPASAAAAPRPGVGARLRGRLRGLSAKLALFFIALSFPALMLVESTIITLEFRHFVRDVDAGALRHAGEAAARDLATRIAREDRAALGDWLGSWVVRLSNPHKGLSAEGAYVLLELSERPLTASLYGRERRAHRRERRGRDRARR
jgi:hypothetical protein